MAALQELDRISTVTLGHYDRQAHEFWRGTRDHDVSQNIEALLRHIEGAAPWTILDFGCGPGRDLAAFAARGHTAIGLDGSAAFVAMARTHSGCEVWRQDFLRLDLPGGRFDAVFANASLFHVPGRELPRVLRELHSALKPRGVLFSSNPRGRDEEGWSGGRYGAYHSLEGWRAAVQAAGFVELEHYYRPAGLPREQQPWLASVWRAVAGTGSAVAADAGTPFAPQSPSRESPGVARRQHMNWDRVEGNWKQLKGKIKEQWGDLTDDDLDMIAGRRDQLAGKIQERYGIARDEADRQISDFETTWRDEDYMPPRH